MIIRPAPFRRHVAAVLLAATLAGTSATAHHGAAAYHTDREISIRGRVAAWQWTQPHTAVILSEVRPGGGEDRWALEGPPLSWARQRGWSTDTLRPGETVEVAAYPSRTNAHAGLVKRIVRANGEVLPVARPWLPGG
ncbi:MAG TPA: DUF6152 family protein [Vicinamibacterales bacterium]